MEGGREGEAECRGGWGAIYNCNICMPVPRDIFLVAYVGFCNTLHAQ